MILFPAIDLFEQKAVRLLRGRYEDMTVYSPDPLAVAEGFREKGARALHLVDLEGARDGSRPHRKLIASIKEKTGLFCEVGGGIRSREAIRDYLDAGIDRVILGTAAVSDTALLRSAADTWGPRIAVGADLMDGFVAVRGWRETTALRAEDFFAFLESLGISAVICTDIRRDGAMQGANTELYRTLSSRFSLQLIASGGVTTLQDVVRLRDLGLYGAIVGRACYEPGFNLAEALRLARASNVPEAGPEGGASC
ncbi:MAG: 1-(5-phosphoribosyl)-5-[(5-phosphoribosylamino)methylideneamino]imidazole-4-carboxamide isomerase [Lachnospiraceae bacterium]|nr:1-(5-phosphoribosyl)-5-[(5-phosphoribosylamino)methylideneamino]imidazole-4-carboxamide isomerase [Lachnospiraceae bacterium]